MSGIAQCFKALKAQGRQALIPYITAGDPHPALCVPLMHAMVEAGAYIIELGVPFSDPMADGPVIQAACERALEHHVRLRDVLAMVETFRKDNAHTPVVLMGYLNPIEVLGYEAFARAAAAAGVDGVLTVDLPPEEGHDLVVALKDEGIDPIFLLAPNSTEARIATICEAGGGFVYYVSLKGITGSAALDVEAVAAKLEEIRAVSDKPIGVGFGIKNAESAARIAGVADAVVVGSAIVQCVADNVTDDAAITARIGELLRAMRAAMDQAA